MTAKKSAAKKKAAAKRKRAKGSSKTKAARETQQAPAIKVGTTLTRTFKGEKHRVRVTADGFAHQGTAYGSLTAIAKAITGYPSVSGPRFFGADRPAPKKGGSK